MIILRDMLTVSRNVTLNKGYGYNYIILSNSPIWERAAGGEQISMRPGEGGNEGDNNYEGYGKRLNIRVLMDLPI
jgi:hypothetical protein